MKRINEFIKKFFIAKNIKGREEFYLYNKRKKIIVFVPEEHVDAVTEKMSNAGAGVIGNYNSCSFRTKGTGTFIPGKNSKPYSGKKNKLSHENEVRLEMVCDNDNLNIVIDVMLKAHPYEETAYEIYDFAVRSKEIAGVIINFRSKEKISTLLKKLNPGIDISMIENDFEYNKLAITDKKEESVITKSAGFLECDCVLILSRNFKIIKIKE
jgi:hypothetical protein